MKQLKLDFQRFEKKYLLSGAQYEALWADISGRLEPDEYFRSTVCSVYYDTDDYALIRHSIEKPVFKEKLRIRSYGVPEDDGEVFVELKKKFKGVVYKRRVKTGALRAEQWISGAAAAPEDTQTAREIDFFISQYRPAPKALIACDREAYVSIDDRELRFTFDKNIRWRDTELYLSAGDHGERLIDEDEVLMEIKLMGAAPLWLASALSRNGIFPTSFSKYGSCYKKELLEKYIHNGVMEFV